MWIEMHSLMAAVRGWLPTEWWRRRRGRKAKARRGAEVGEYEDACLCGVSA
jgi:hypothetical protein